MRPLLLLLVLVAAPPGRLGVFWGLPPAAESEGSHGAPSGDPGIRGDLLNASTSGRGSCCYAEGVARATEALKVLTDTLASILARTRPHDGVSRTDEEGASCPYPFTQVVYECFYTHRKKLTWEQARRVCLGMGGDLAEPRHPYALQAYLADTYGPGYFWVGGTDEGAEGAWHWVSGPPIDPEDWLFSRPDNLGGDEHCLEMVMSDYPRLFNDETCSVPQRFICQYRRREGGLV